MSVRFTLPASAPVRLELVDVAGRAVVAREVGGLGVGEHSVELEAGRGLHAGLYFVRLTQGGDVRTARVTVLE